MRAGKLQHHILQHQAFKSQEFNSVMGPCILYPKRGHAQIMEMKLICVQVNCPMLNQRYQKARSKMPRGKAADMT